MFLLIINFKFYCQSEGRILAGYYGFDVNISFTLQAVKNLFTHYTYLCFRLFCKFLGGFWVYLGLKLWKSGNLGRFDVVLISDFEV